MTQEQLIKIIEEQKDLKNECECGYNKLGKREIISLMDE